MKLSEKAVMVSLNISRWEAKVSDKAASNQVENTNSAKRGSTTVKKSLLPNCREHERLMSEYGQLRLWHYTNTLPWNDNGIRVLPAGNTLDYMQEFRERNEKINGLLRSFLEVYPAEIFNAQISLGHLYDAKLYPTESEITRKFNVSLVVEPLPDSNDFRNFEGFTEGEVDKMASELENRLQSRADAAMDDLVNRLLVPLESMAEKLAVPIGGDGGVFRDTLVENIREAASLLPRLNMASSPMLNKWASDAAALASVSIESLRTDAGSRDVTMGKAKQIANEMKEWFV